MKFRSKSAERIVIAVGKGYRVERDGTPVGPTGVVRGSLHKTGRTKNPYLSFTVKVDGASRRVFVHQVQAYQKFGCAALGEGIHTRHLDGDSLNNEWDNIAIGDAVDNSMDRPEEERKNHAQRAANARKQWSDADVRRLREARVEGARAKDLAAQEGVSKGQMSDMLNGRTYKGVQ